MIMALATPIPEDPIDRGFESFGRDDEMGDLGRIIDQARARLLENGPEVRYDAIYALIDRALEPAESARVEEQISTWKNWHDAYWEVYRLLKRSDQEDKSSQEGSMST
jgi:hypothetical protein